MFQIPKPPRAPAYSFIRHDTERLSIQVFAYTRRTSSTLHARGAKAHEDVSHVSFKVLHGSLHTTFGRYY